VPDILAVHAAAKPDKVALREDDRAVTYAELNRRSNRAAHAFRSLGVGDRDRVAVMKHNSIEGFEIGSGLRKIKAVGVPVNFRLRGSEVAYILNDSGARVVVAGGAFVEVVDSVRDQVDGVRTYIAVDAQAPTGWLDYERLLAAASEDEPEDLDAALGASMIYTSGTTGHPKGAYRPDGVKMELVIQTIQAFELTSSDVHLMAGPGYHSAVSLFTALTLALGGTVVIMPKFDAERALQLIERHRVSTTFAAPVLVQRMIDVPEKVRARYDVSSLRSIYLGAAPCPHSLKERAIAYFGEVLWEFYGATETGVNTVLRPEDQLRKPGSCGQVTNGSEVRLLDEAGNEVPIGTPGQLWVRYGGMAEYFNKPDATNQAMQDGFFTVGDVAYRDAEGFYFICDRKVDMIISGGVNIYPAEVEAALHAHPAVRDVAVIGVPDDQWGESVKAVVELQPGAQATADELIAWCAERLADYKKPRSVDFVEELPRGTDGKLLKRKVREPYWAAAGRRI
jgi:acyl-CoA synthetase (AMP-forming)/AMP-acid ligase II